MKRMSFAKTIEQVRSRQKTVTRRHPDRWKSLEAGDRLLAVEKVMGFKKGEKAPPPLALIEVVDVRVEPVENIDREELFLEGLGILTPLGFKVLWDRMYPDRPADCRRIEFRYIDEEAPA